MDQVIRIGWLVLAFMVSIRLLSSPGWNGQANLLEAVIYQLTDGTPRAVGALF